MAAPGSAARPHRSSGPACRLGPRAALLCLGVLLDLITGARACGHTLNYNEQAEAVQRYLESKPLLQQSVGKVRARGRPLPIARALSADRPQRAAPLPPAPGGIPA
jgi:hypothetical protein